jgi:hypothetical protein
MGSTRLTASTFSAPYRCGKASPASLGMLVADGGGQAF